MIQFLKLNNFLNLSSGLKTKLVKENFLLGRLNEEEKVPFNISYMTNS